MANVMAGALVVLDSAGLIGFVPRIIPFQFNPDNLNRQLKPFVAQRDGEGSEGDQDTRSQPFDPQETFTLKLTFDASGAMENPDENPVTSAFGLSGYLAQLEQLLYPVGETFIGVPDLLSGISGAISDDGEPLPRPSAPVVLFSWGPSRILPVRITSYSVDEKNFSRNLYPIHAVATVGLQVLTPEQLGVPRNPDPDTEITATPMEKLAAAAYLSTMAQKELIAIASIGEKTADLISQLD